MAEKLYKSFTTIPISVADKKTGEELDLDIEMGKLREDVELLTSLAQRFLNNYQGNICDHAAYYVDELRLNQPSSLGLALGAEVPQEIKQQRKSGNSRYEKMLADYVGRSVKSQLERSKAYRGETEKFVSSGWTRTANDRSQTSFAPKMSLAAASNNSYCFIANDPFKDGYITMPLVISGNWRIVTFAFDKKRFGDGTKLCKPDVTVRDGKVRFNFSVEYDYFYGDISSKYVVGVDVGVTTYATYSVVRHDGEVVETGNLSQRVHALHNSIKASLRQNTVLYKQWRFREAALHRQAASRKRRELAILAAQEIAEKAFLWGNAAVIVEDLSWISNTMESGRWNRGEFVKRLTEYVELNGSRVLKTSAYNTSQQCSSCSETVTHPVWKLSQCLSCGLVIDRDVNAAINIARKGSVSAAKASATRKKSKKYLAGKVKQRSTTQPRTLKYPGRDRTKTAPTPKRKRSKGVSSFKCSTTDNEDLRVVVDGELRKEVNISGTYLQHVTSSYSVKMQDMWDD